VKKKPAEVNWGSVLSVRNKDPSLKFTQDGLLLELTSRKSVEGDPVDWICSESTLEMAFKKIEAPESFRFGR
jgi:hypothetical protein